MDRLNISKSILSITSPGTHLVEGDHELAKKITRETNIEVQQICAKHPNRFAFFASLPVPDVEGSLAEIEYALNHLHAVGFALMTNAHGHYLGDDAMDQIFAKLNERKAIVFMHPTKCHIGCGSASGYPLQQYPAPMLEFIFDTTRAVTNLLLSGTVQRYPDITFIVSHAGAALPPVIERFTVFGANVLGKAGGLTGDDVKELFKSRFYFDLAGPAFPDQIHGLLRVTDRSRLLYGSDYPYTSAAGAERLAKSMDQGFQDMFETGRRKSVISMSSELSKIYSDNARYLLGQWNLQNGKFDV